MRHDFPAPQGLYDPEFEHDSCGVSFVVDMKGRRSHAIVDLGLRALCNLDHRGAKGAEPDTGDGAGILVQMPDRFFREIVDFTLPPVGHYVSGIAFLEPNNADLAQKAVEEILTDEGFTILGWRDVPVNAAVAGPSAREVMPTFRQVFASKQDLAGVELDRHVYCARKRIERETPDQLDGIGVYFPRARSTTRSTSWAVSRQLIG